MQFKGSSRPSKPVSALAVIVGVGFIILGITVAIPEAGLFGWLWTILAFLITGFHLFNILFANGVAEEVYDITSANQKQPNEVGHRMVEDRLKKLEALKQKGIISESEYKAQREKILNEI
jgi:membrane-bound ClpP family serine protease